MTTDLPSGLSRRTLLKGAAAGVAGLGAVPLLAACTGASSGGDSGDGSGSTTMGSGASDEKPKAGIQAMVDGFQKANSGSTVKINTVSHNDFQENINNYLNGSPDDTFTWFAGYRMRYYAKKGLVAPVDDAWEAFGGDFSDAFAQASTGDDGKKYFVPNYNYPWAVFYKKSVWAAKGYEEPTTFDQLLALCNQMKADGLTPIAFGDSDGWPAMGTFDYLNLRTNGYQFHVDLMAHKESWDSDKVRAVFDNWKQILPFHDTGALGRTWQDAALTVVQEKAGMYLLGSFVAQQFDNADDYDFFLFPEIDSQWKQDTIEAPIDGFMLTKKGGDNATAMKLMSYLGTAEAEQLYAEKDPSNVAGNKQVPTDNYSALQKKSAEVIGQASNITQFLDRDSLPAFASNVMIPALQNFYSTGNFDTSGVESQAKQLFASES
jgi:multiple sugar transport system substrate-binding protein